MTNRRPKAHIEMKSWRHVKRLAGQLAWKFQVNIGEAIGGDHAEWGQCHSVPMHFPPLPQHSPSRPQPPVPLLLRLLVQEKAFWTEYSGEVGSVYAASFFTAERAAGP